MAKMYNASPVTGNANGKASGSLIPGNQIFMGSDGFSKVGSLSALVSVTAATSTITFAGKWQGSNDATTWVDMANSNNAANVTIATGTAAIVTKSYDAPLGAPGWRYARFALVTGVTTGAAGDLYSIGYNYRQLVGAGGVGGAV